MAKDTVSIRIPLPGQMDFTASLPVAEKVTVNLPALGFRAGKFCHVVLQWDKGGSFYGIPGAAWRLGDGQPVKATLDLTPEPGATGLRLSLYTDVEAFTTPVTDEAKLSLM